MELETEIIIYKLNKEAKAKMINLDLKSIINWQYSAFYKRTAIILQQK